VPQLLKALAEFSTLEVAVIMWHTYVAVLQKQPGLELKTWLMQF